MKTKILLLAVLMILILSGCSLPPPADSQGTAWSEDWVTVGNVIGVDTPEGLTPRENIDTLAVSEIYYATWSIGEEESFKTAEDTDSTVYDAQIYLLIQGRETVETAESDVSAWLALAEERYAIENRSTGSYGGQAFTILTYNYTGEDNPYARGAAAYGLYGNFAVSVEVSCREAFEGDAAEILTDFLEHCHYAA